MIELDSRQLEIAAVDRSMRQLVVAGPGTGKTTVVGALVEQLYDSGLDEFGSILVVSFSRAAVSVVRSRLASRSTALRAVEVRTLDSLARRIVSDQGLDVHHDFERVVIEAAGVLREDSSRTLMDRVDFLVVDEVQDLDEHRAALVLSMIDALPQSGGYTLLGDPLQGIFRFRDREGDGTWNEFTSALASRGLVREPHLDRGYRFGPGDPSRAAGLGPELRAARSDRERAETIDRFLPTLAVVDIDTIGLLRWPGSTAILVKNNGDVSEVATRLARCGVRVDITRTADDIRCAPWLSQLADEHGGQPVSREQFEEFADGRDDLPENAWRDLRALVGGDKHVDLGKVSMSLRSGRRPTGLETPARQELQVSTIHRAKGLEFHNVALYDGEYLVSPSRDDRDLRVSEAFVAVTRAERRLVRLDFPEPPRIGQDRSTGRWYRSGWKRWQTFGFELRGADCRSGSALEEQAEIQDYLRTTPMGGARIEFTLDPSRSSELYPVYDATHEGHLVARTSLEFGSQLAKRLRGPRKTGRMWPDLGAGYVSGCETQFGEPAPKSKSAAIRSGLWLGIRVFGMTEVKWGENDG